VIQFGIVFNNYLTLTDAARAGARKAAVGRQLTDPVTATKMAVASSVCSPSGSSCNLKGFSAGGSTSCGADVTVSSTWQPAADATNNVRLGSGTVTVTSKIVNNDTITVTVKRPAPGFFSKLFGVKSVTAGAKATARAGALTTAKYVAPITVHYKHPFLNCTGPSTHPTCNPTFGAETTLDLEDLHQKGGGSGAGAFGLINLKYGDPDGNVGAGTLADWLHDGNPNELPTGTYYSAPSANFNNSQFTDSLNFVLGKEVLFPVYRLLTGPGSNAKYDIIGWVGFVITSFDNSGSSGTLTGHFTT